MTDKGRKREFNAKVIKKVTIDIEEIGRPICGVPSLSDEISIATGGNV